MGKIVDMENRRHQHRHKLKDARADEMRESFRQARRFGKDERSSSDKLLDIFRRKRGKSDPASGD